VINFSRVTVGAWSCHSSF